MKDIRLFALMLAILLYKTFATSRVFVQDGE